MALSRLPHQLDETTIPGVLSAIGIPMADVRHLIAAGQPISASGYRRSEAQLDEAIAKNTTLDVSDRIRLKITMQHHGLLGR